MRPLQRSADTEEFTFRLDTLRYRHCVLISVRPWNRAPTFTLCRLQGSRSNMTVDFRDWTFSSRDRPSARCLSLIPCSRS
jgi:hypothetical protein